MLDFASVLQFLISCAFQKHKSRFDLSFGVFSFSFFFFKIMALGTPCRKSANTCDLPEYCDGTNEFCPNDFYLMDGLPCENNTAYCYEGRCQTYDYQCRHLFAPGRSSNNLLLFYAFSFQ